MLQLSWQVASCSGGWRVSISGWRNQPHRALCSLSQFMYTPCQGGKFQHGSNQAFCPCWDYSEVDLNSWSHLMRACFWCQLMPEIPWIRIPIWHRFRPPNVCSSTFWALPGLSVYATWQPGRMNHEIGRRHVWYVNLIFLIICGYVVTCDFSHDYFHVWVFDVFDVLFSC